MTLMTNLMWFILIFILGLGVGGIILQVFLSRRENPYLGLILPIFSFLLSLLPIVNVMVPPGGTAADVLVPILVAVLLGNIPTVILLCIYFACRKKIKKHRQLDKMNIQDIE